MKGETKTRAGFTAGPWDWFRMQGSGWGIGAGHEVLAEAVGVDDEAEANARLIASAPDLLQAARTAEAALWKQKNGGVSAAEREDAHLGLQQAIQKATEGDR